MTDTIIHSRNIRNLDIFIHPTCLDRLEHQDNGIDQFTHRLWEKFTTSQARILLIGAGEGSYEREIGKEFCIQTYRRPISITSYGLLGYAIDAELDKFLEILNSFRGYSIRIHGSFFGLCTQDCFQQVYFYLHENVIWSLNKKFFKGRDLSKRQFIKLGEYERKGTFLNSDIRYGITLCAQNKNERFIEPNEQYPYGSINYQLTDRDSETFRQSLFTTEW